MATSVKHEDPLSHLDTIMWHEDKWDPYLRSPVTSVVLLDQAIARDRLMSELERIIENMPRLQQRVVEYPYRLALPRWEADPHFDLNYHVRWMRAPGVGSLREVLNMAAPIAMQTFDRERALWELTVVDGLANGGMVLITKRHHAITDSTGFFQTIRRLLGSEPRLSSEPNCRTSQPPHKQPNSRLTASSELGPDRRTASAWRAPAHATRAILRDVQATLHDLAPQWEPLSSLMSERSLNRRFDILTQSMLEMRSAARAAYGWLNDAFLASIAGGLCLYHQHHGASVDHLRVSVPMNIRDKSSPNATGNQFILARFLLPIEIVDPAKRIQTIRSIVRNQRHYTARPGFAKLNLAFLCRLPPRLISHIYGGVLKGIDVETTNVSCSRRPLEFAGTNVQAQYTFLPLTGSAVGISINSYMDRMNLGVVTDPYAIPDPNMFIECLSEGFNEVLSLSNRNHVPVGATIAHQSASTHEINEPQTAIEDRIEDYVRHHLLADHVLEEKLDHTCSLVKKGIIDSVGVLELANLIEREYFIEISDEDLSPEYFDSIDSISRYIRTRIGHGDKTHQQSNHNGL